MKNNRCLILSHVNQPYYDFHIQEFSLYFEKVVNFNYMEYFREYGLVSLENNIDKIIEEEKITYIILWQWYTNYIPRLEFLEKLREKCFVVLWLFDDDVFFHAHGKFYAQVSDVVVTTDYFGAIMYEQLNILSIFYVPTYDKNLYKNSKSKKNIDVSFVGGLDKADRREYINYLIENNINVEVFGAGSKNGHVTFEEMIDIFNRSRINLNFTKIGFSDSIIEANPFVERVRQNKGRPIEIGLTNSFCLSEDAPSLKYIFNIEKELDTFSDKYELLDKVKYYLSNSQKIEEKANELYQNCITKYDKEVYFQEIFTKLNTIHRNKDRNKVYYYNIRRNNIFAIKEKSFYLRSGLVFLIKKRNIKVFFELFKAFLYKKNYLSFYAIVEMFKKYSKGKSK